MGQEIHARNTSEGIMFKIWSTHSDSYITGVMTEAEVREWTLKAAVNHAIEEHLRTIDARIQRTCANGTSPRSR